MLNTKFTSHILLWWLQWSPAFQVLKKFSISCIFFQFRVISGFLKIRQEIWPRWVCPKQGESDRVPRVVLVHQSVNRLIPSSFTIGHDEWLWHFHQTTLIETVPWASLRNFAINEQFRRTMLVEAQKISCPDDFIVAVKFRPSIWHNDKAVSSFFRCNFCYPWSSNLQLRASPKDKQTTFRTCKLQRNVMANQQQQPQTILITWRYWMVQKKYIIINFS